MFSFISKYMFNKFIIRDKKTSEEGLLATAHAWSAWHRILPVFFAQQQPQEFDQIVKQTVVTIVYGKPKKLLAESRTMSLSLRRFVALPKIVQADYQPRRLQDKTAQITV